MENTEPVVQLLFHESYPKGYGPARAMLAAGFVLPGASGKELNYKMKKCPYCAEDIQDQAIVCRHCKRNLAAVPQPQTTVSQAARNTNQFNLHRDVDWKKVLKVSGIVLLVIISFQLWYITIPGAAIWYLWKKAKFSKKTNIIATASLVVVFAILEGMAAYASRTPTLAITEPQNNYSVQAQSVSLKGKVSPAKSVVLVNGNRVPTDGGGSFSYQVQLASEGGNQVTVTASNGEKQAKDSLTINRIFTDEEKAAKAKAEADAAAKAKADAEAQAKAQAEAAAQAKAEQAAYDNSKAGKLCKAHPTWTTADCQSVADGKISIGMTYDMLKAIRGAPDHVNTSNYGRGNEYQACWPDYDTSCFYFGEDGIITSYN